MPESEGVRFKESGSQVSGFSVLVLEHVVNLGSFSSLDKFPLKLQSLFQLVTFFYF